MQDHPVEKDATCDTKRSLEDISARVNALSDKINRYLAALQEGPSTHLFMAGIQSALENIVRACQKNRDGLEQATLTLGAMRASIDDTNTNIRAIRNRVYCFAGDEQLRRARELEDKEKHD